MGFETCGPDEVIVVSGVGHGRPLVINGGRAYVWPFIQQVKRLNLNVFTVVVQSNKVYTKEGVAIDVTGIAQCKIESSVESMLRSAIQQFLGKTPAQIANITLGTLECHQRAIMGTMSIEDIYQDRKAFAEAVFQVASTDLSKLGISIVSFTLKDVADQEGYLKALGMKRTAEVKRDASIGEAEAKSISGIEEAKANEQLYREKYKNETEIESAKRGYNIKKAEFDREVQTKRAEADLATSLASAKVKQLIREEEIQIQVVERRKQIEVQKQEIVRRERELNAVIMKPAEAEKYRVEALAEASRIKQVREAEAQSEVIRLRGEAEAFAIREKAKANKEKMSSKADAWSEYQDAAVVSMVLEAMPRIAAEVAAPLAQTNKIIMVSNGKGEVGASKITNELLDIISALPGTVEKLTGVNMVNAIRSSVSAARA